METVSRANTLTDQFTHPSWTAALSFKPMTDDICFGDSEQSVNQYIIAFDQWPLDAFSVQICFIAFHVLLIYK